MAFGDFAIAPSTTITLCAGVPLAKGSEDTLYFGSASSQASTIGGYAIATFSDCTYQRNTRNVARVGMPMGVSGASSALRANYCIFNNSAFEGKPIYCFVDSVDYVNNNTIDVHFTVDAMQTFMFDYTLGQCFVEREHSETDQIGDNVVAEEFDSTDTVVHSRDEQFLFTETQYTKYSTVIYYIENTGYDVDAQGKPKINSDGQLKYDLNNYSVTGSVVNHVYVAASYAGILTTAQNINDKLIDIMQHGGTIVGIFEVPHDIVAAGSQGWVNTGQVLINTDFKDGDTTYTPKNAKLFTYPYNYITVTNNAGDEQQYRWERFATPGTASFSIVGGYQPSPECAIIPDQYEGVANNYGRMVFFNSFPTCAWSEDSFLSWRLRNGNSYDTSVRANAYNTVMGTISGGLAGAAVGKMGGIGPIGGAITGGISGLMSGLQKNAELVAQKMDMAATPDKLAGNSSASVVNEVIGSTGFTIYRMNLAFEQAKTIDDYFTMYGYATKKVKTPNRDVRPHWTYTKTLGCTIYGNIPAEFATEIQARYNNGVRFWKSAVEVGNYSLDNSV